MSSPTPNCLCVSPNTHLCLPPPSRKAKLMLDDIVSRGRGGPPGQFHDNANGQNGTVQEIMIPAGKAGLVIGKGGETIKQLQVSPDHPPRNKTHPPTGCIFGGGGAVPPAHPPAIGASRGEDDPDPRRFPKHQCRQTLADNRGSLQSPGETPLLPKKHPTPPTASCEKFLPNLERAPYHFLSC